jgi:hypothetical protein
MDATPAGESEDLQPAAPFTIHELSNPELQANASSGAGAPGDAARLAPPVAGT